jgi:hydrogenase maturation factor
MNETPLPVGKLPVELLSKILSQAPISDSRVLLGPGIGLDCAIIDLGQQILVFKSDPITFATDEIGWYAVQVASNDIATTGATPRWFLATLLLPEGKTTPSKVEEIADQLYSACRKFGISVVGGHTEVTYGLDRPLLVGSLIGEVEKENLVLPTQIAPGDKLLVTKQIPLEAAAILSREFPEKLAAILTPEELATAADYLHNPGISVLKDAQVAVKAGQVTGMHDPTEGGLAAALWELSEACGHSFRIDPDKIPVSNLSRKICQFFDLNPLASIASGSLLMAVKADDAKNICAALEAEDIPCTEIGQVEEGPVAVWINDDEKLERPERDDIGKVYAES